MNIEDLTKKVDLIQNELNDIKKQLSPKSVNTKKEDQKSNEANGFFETQDANIGQNINKIQDSIKEMLKGDYFSVLIITGRYKNKDGSTEGWSSASKYKTIKELPENDISQMLEPFSNPRRITIMKELFNLSLRANELSTKTGLVGGQLYHHISFLEKSNIILRTGDEYTLTSKGIQILLMLASVSGLIYGEKDPRQNEDPKQN